MQFTSVESVEQYLEQIPKFQSVGTKAANFDLSRFKKFCASMDDPQHNFPSIHVAGTNGKGSTCRILESVLRESGYNVGLYTSPHILDFRERFRINGSKISANQLLVFFQKYANKLEQYELSYFEISTAIAFWWFSKSEIDVGIIEVGLGGRLDATNVVDPIVSIITSISLDHTDILGESIEEIAREKAGIIKKARPVVIGDLPEPALKQIHRIAAQKESPVIPIEDISLQFVTPGRYQLTLDGEQINIRTNLMAPVQAKNLAIAWQVLQQIQGKYPISQEQFLTSLRDLDMGFGRFEKLIDTQRWYFDGGHNLEAVKALKQSVRTVGNLDEAILILSMMKDKIRPAVMDSFSEFKNIYYYPLGLERAATFDDIEQWLPHVKPYPDDHNQQSFLDDFVTELVIFSGSFYFYKTVRDWVSSFALNH